MIRRAGSRARRSRRTADTIRGLTLDAGALIAFEREDRALIARLKEAVAAGRRVTIPTAVVVETWRGGRRSARLALLLAGCVIEELGELLARRAGELLGKVPGATAIDAVVAVSAAARGDVVLTADAGDLSALAAHLPGVDVVEV